MSLTQTEAEARAALLDVSGYQVHLQPFPPTARPSGPLRVISFTCSEPGAETFVEIACAELLAAELQWCRAGSGRAHRQIGSRCRPGPRPTGSWSPLTSPTSNTSDGMVRYDDPLDGEVYLGAYLGMDLAHLVFACLDQVDLKAPISLTVQTEPETARGREQSGRGAVAGAVVTSIRPHRCRRIRSR